MRVIALASVLLGAVIFVGCGGSTATGTNASRAAEASSTVTSTSTSIVGKIPRRALWSIEADTGASQTACRAHNATPDPTAQGLCLNRSTPLATGDDVVRAPVVRTSGGWFVQLSLTAAATGRLRKAGGKGSIFHLFVRGKYFQADLTLPLILGDATEPTARTLAAELRP